MDKAKEQLIDDQAMLTVERNARIVAELKVKKLEKAFKVLKNDNAVGKSRADEMEERV